MSETYLAIRIAGKQVAVGALSVQSLIVLDTIVPVPHAPKHILGLTSVRSRVLTVVDPAKLLGSAEEHAATDKSERHAVVMEIAGHGYAVLVDAVLNVTDAVAAPGPAPDDLGSGWSRFAEGIVETDLGPLLVLNGEQLVTGVRQTKAA